MIGIYKIGAVIFVKDDDASDKYIEQYRAEIGPRCFRLKVNKTLCPPEYELFEDWKEGKRNWSRKLYATSRADKLKDYIIQ